MCPWGLVSCKNTPIYKPRAGDYRLMYYGKKQEKEDHMKLEGLRIDKQRYQWMVSHQPNDQSRENLLLECNAHSHH